MSVKSGVLSALEAKRGEEISGQELADSLNVTRAAVWKAIEALRAQGHQIDAVNNRGYRLLPESGALSEEGIRARLPESLKGVSITALETVDSTSTLLKRMALEGAGHGTIVVANQQTAGRGRFGKSFYSPGDTGLYMSVLLRPGEVPAFDAQRITVAAAVRVCEAIKSVTGREPLIKWVNDLYWNGRKICGILTEAAGDFESGRIESVVIGVGVNLSTQAFPDAIRDIACSLDAGGVNRCALTASIASGLLDAWERSGDPAILEAYRARSFLPGQEIEYAGYDGVSHIARALSIDDMGRLVVSDADGTVRALSSGEVSVRRRGNP